MSGEDLDDKKRDLRDQLLEPLVEHIHEVNAFVRTTLAIPSWDRQVPDALTGRGEFLNCCLSLIWHLLRQPSLE